MGWTHDYRDVSRNHLGTTASGRPAPPAALADRGQLLPLPRILRRRARWVGARLRHTARTP
ncbi:hypothetical protein ABZ832_18560 [Streptantibioticus parmotrematis]|uniref:hypothetical protein n=1 Tax=Streptantibioticus parmotrematis TaxID=2873249 RepID=UPI0033FD04E4